MTLWTGPGGLHPLSGAGGTAGNGDWQVWNNDGGQPSYLPYNSGTPYYQVVFLNNGAHSRITGTCYWNCNISQNHGGMFHFEMSQYSVAIEEEYNSGGSSMIVWGSSMSINSAAGTNGIKWTNNTTATWGNGHMYTTVILHGAGATTTSYGMKSGEKQGSGQSNYAAGSGVFLTKVI